LATRKGTDFQVLTPKEVAKKERIYYSPKQNIVLGSSIQNLFTELPSQHVVEKINQRYILLRKKHETLVFFSEAISQQEILMVYFEARCPEIWTANFSALVAGKLQDSGWNIESNQLGSQEWRYLSQD